VSSARKVVTIPATRLTTDLAVPATLENGFSVQMNAEKLV
jgi:hypothetical protein